MKASSLYTLKNEYSHNSREVLPISRKSNACSKTLQNCSQARCWTRGRVLGELSLCLYIVLMLRNTLPFFFFPQEYFSLEPLWCPGLLILSALAHLSWGCQASGSSELSALRRTEQCFPCASCQEEQLCCHRQLSTPWQPCPRDAALNLEAAGEQSFYRLFLSTRLSDWTSFFAALPCSFLVLEKASLRAQRSNDLFNKSAKLNQPSTNALLGSESILEASCFYFPISLSEQRASVEAEQSQCQGRTQLEGREHGPASTILGALQMPGKGMGSALLQGPPCHLAQEASALDDIRQLFWLLSRDGSNYPCP